eukprot:5584359-Lingulodinium_polyedra.AAC.1
MCIRDSLNARANEGLEGALRFRRPQGVPMVSAEIRPCLPRANVGATSNLTGPHLGPVSGPLARQVAAKKGAQRPQLDEVGQRLAKQR